MLSALPESVTRPLLVQKFGGSSLGTPGRIIDQLRQYESVGFDQLCFGMPNGLSYEQALSTIRLFGDEVIPEFDRDPVHRSTRMRNNSA